MKRLILVITMALTSMLSSSCSSKKSKETPKNQEANSTQTTAATPKPERRGLRDMEHTILRSTREKVVRKTPAGETESWKREDGITITSESLAQLYKSREQFFVSFKADISAEAEDCLVSWKADLIEGDTGRGTIVDSLKGEVPIPRGSQTTISAATGLSAVEAEKVGSVHVGYWTLCGGTIPDASSLDFEITKAEPEAVAMSKSISVQHTSIALESKQKPATDARCHVDVIVEDIDSRGYTLNRDFATFSLAPGSDSHLLLRRTAFEGGDLRDYSALVADKRAYLSRVSCITAWDASTASAQGVRINKLTLHAHVPTTKTVDSIARTSYQHSARLTNTTGKDCSFQVRYRVLDKNGVPFHKTPALSEVLHLASGKEVNYRSATHRLYVWNAHVDQVGSLVVQSAAPIADCSTYDPKLAVGQ